MSQIPMPIRMGIRDSWQKEDSQVQKSFKNLSAVVGLEVFCEPEWQMLWVELESSFPDKTTFIPTIAKWVSAWSDTLATRLDNDDNSDWTDELLTKLNPVQRIKLLINVSHDESRPKAEFSSEKPAFVLLLPTKSVSPSMNTSSGFHSDFDDLFKPKLQKPGDANKDDEWADIDSSGNSKTIAIRELSSNPAALPDVQTLARPDLLFPTVTPYVLRVTHGGNSMTIQSTHESSLRLLEEYFKRWVKIDPQDTRRPPFLKITLIESLFGPGLFYDTLTIEPYDSLQARRIVLNPTLVQAFIEGVMGFEPVQSSYSAGCWEYRKKATS